jgi:hypothetical protein
MGGGERNKSGGRLDMHVYWSWRRGKPDGAGFQGRHSMGNDLPESTLAHTGLPFTARNPDAGGSARAHALCLICIARAALLMCQRRAAPVKCQRSPSLSQAVSGYHSRHFSQHSCSEVAARGGRMYPPPPPRPSGWAGPVEQRQTIMELPPSPWMDITWAVNCLCSTLAHSGRISTARSPDASGSARAQALVPGRHCPLSTSNVPAQLSTCEVPTPPCHESG